jgi:hypothetical protein
MATFLAIFFSIGIFVLCVIIDWMLGTAPFLTFSLVIGTTIWAGIDAKKIGAYKYKNYIASDPVFLVLGSLLFWIIVFPSYLWLRGKIDEGSAELKDGYKNESKSNLDIEPKSLDDLEKLYNLKEKGILTEEEFQEQKKKILPK